jgi:hypothetical protein
MNLGTFAGGAVQGYQSQERLNLAQQEAADSKNFRERSMRMQEQDAAARQEALDRAKKMREDSAALFAKYYGDKTETIGESEADDGTGNLVKVPITKSVSYKPGDDPTGRDNEWLTEHLKLSAKYNGMKPDEVFAVAKHIDEARRTETGKVLDKVLMGDDKAQDKFLTSIGKNPEGAKLVRDPANGVMKITLADGTDVDLMRAAHGMALSSYAADLRKEMDSARKSNVDQSVVKKNEAQAAKANAEASGASELNAAHVEESKAKAGQARAAAGLSVARASNVKMKGTEMAEDKAGRETRAEIASVIEKDPNAMDGKSKDPAMAKFLQGRATAVRLSDKKKPSEAVAQATREYVGLTKAVDDTMGKMSPAAKLKNFPNKDGKKPLADAEIRKKLLDIAIERSGLQMAGEPAPAAPKGGSSTDDNEDNDE